MMTRKQFQAIAEILKNTGYAEFDGVKYIVFNELLCNLRDYFIKENPRFDAEKFRNAIEKAKEK